VRTTVTLDPDADALVQRAMRERGLSFKEALNLAIRRGLGAEPASERYTTPTFDMGVPKVDLTKSLQLAGDLEDAELMRKLREGK
jgi:hypothetical protein